MLMTPSAPLRRSALEAYACPARFQQIYVLGRQDTSDPARRGSAFHRAAEFYLLALAERRERSNAEVAADALHDAFVAEQTPAHLMADVENLWQRWTEGFELDLEAFLLAEERQIVGGRFTFTPDAVYARPEELEIVDLKTHFQALTETQAKAELQSRMYACLAARIWPGFPRYRFTYQFVRVGVTVSVAWEPSELDAIERQLDALEDGIRAAQASGDYPAVPGAHCAYCHFACPLTDDAHRLPVRLQTADEATRIAGELLVLETAVAAKRRALSAWCAVEGPVAAGSVEWAHRPAESVSYPAAKVIDVLREQDVDVSGFTLGKIALKPYVATKKRAHLRPLLEPLAVTEAGTKFGKKKIGAVGDEPADEE